MAEPNVFIDQMDREVVLKAPLKRIISLVPSQTELLYYLGLDEEVIAQTLFCIHPENQHKNKPRIGGTKIINLDKIRALKPDLIIGNKEENEQSQVEELMQEFPVWMSDIQNLDDALDMIDKIGKLVQKEENAKSLVNEISIQFSALKLQKMHKSCLYLIWREPFMAAGSDTFINDMLQKCGFNNIAKNIAGRYPEINLEDLKTMHPELILLSSEPYPFKQKHINELQLICPKSTILLVDGELFSWYGNRLLKSASYFEQIQAKIFL